MKKTNTDIEKAFHIFHISSSEITARSPTHSKEEGKGKEDNLVGFNRQLHL